MRAARIFVCDLQDLGVLNQVNQLRVDLYGSLAMTGVGHGTPNAVLMGLEGETPEGIEPNRIPTRVDSIYSHSYLNLCGHHRIPFTPKKHLTFHYGTFLVIYLFKRILINFFCMNSLNIQME